MELDFCVEALKCALRRGKPEIFNRDQGWQFTSEKFTGGGLAVERLIRVPVQSRSIRKGAILNSGSLSPNPWDLTLSGQNGWPYNEGTRTEDKAPQGCDLSADSGTGTATGGFDADAAQNSNSDPPSINLLRTENGLDNALYFNISFLSVRSKRFSSAFTDLTPRGLHESIQMYHD